MISGVHVCVLVVTPMCLHISGSPDQWCTLGLCDNENSPITIIQPSITIITIMPYILEVQQNYKYELRTLQFRTK